MPTTANSNTYTSPTQVGQFPREGPRIGYLPDFTFLDTSGQSTQTVNLQDVGISQVSTLELDNRFNPIEMIATCIEASFNFVVPPLSIVRTPIFVSSLQFTLRLQFDPKLVSVNGPANGASYCNNVTARVFNVLLPYSVQYSTGAAQLFTSANDAFYATSQGYSYTTTTTGSVGLLLPANPTRNRFRITMAYAAWQTNTSWQIWNGDASGAAGLYSDSGAPGAVAIGGSQGGDNTPYPYYEEIQQHPKFPITTANVYVKLLTNGGGVQNIYAKAWPW